MSRSPVGIYSVCRRQDDAKLIKILDIPAPLLSIIGICSATTRHGRSRLASEAALRIIAASEEWPRPPLPQYQPSAATRTYPRAYVALLRARRPPHIRHMPPP